ncbi:MAG: CocE/NonD family hydrolase [Pirellulaceae bacterium]
MSHRLQRRSRLKLATRHIVAAFFFASLLQTLAPSAATRGEDAIVVEKDVAVPMRDGVVLRANVFRPPGEGPFPVLLMRTPYGKPGKANEQLIRAGYIVVAQDARGRFASEGVYESFNRPETHDAADGHDTIEWAAKMEGSNGKVGLLGTSYPAFLQWRAAGRQPPSLVAMAAFSIPARYTDLEGPGTIRPGRRLKWWHGTMSPDLRRRADGPKPHTRAEAIAQWDDGEGDRLLHFLPWNDLPDEIFAGEAPFVKAWLKEPWRDPWKLDRDAQKTVVPNLNVCGWYDHCNGSIDLHTAIAEHGASPLAREQSKLIVGPWGHSALGQRKQGEIDFGPAAQVDLTQLQLDWFGHWMQGDKSKDFVEDWAPVRLFVMGAGQWRDYQHWPPRGATPQTWFLTSGGRANTPAGDGRLVTEKPTSSGHDHYTYDPRDPVPTLWTSRLFTVPADQKPLAARRDILVYQTNPLTEAVETIGYPEVVLEASSDCPDTDFFARLIDVAPDGQAIDVASGMVRARYRDSLKEPKLLQPGEVTEMRIRLRPTAHRFLPGHRLRLDVTSSDFPNYDRHHNTAADQNADAQLVIAAQTIHHGPAHASRLVLPLMPIE